MTLGDIICDRIELCIDRTIDKIVLIITNDRTIRRNRLNGQIVDLAKLRIFGHSGTGHAGKLIVEPEEVLQRDGRKRLVLLAHEHVLFRLECLVKTL